MPSFPLALYVSARADIDAAAIAEVAPDLLIIDLEDSVPLPQKPEARARLRAFLKAFHAPATRIAIRINNRSEQIAEDVAALRSVQGWSDIVLPRPRSEGTGLALAELNKILGERPGSCLWLMGEQPDFHNFVDALAPLHPHVHGVLIGYKDLARSIGVPMDPADPLLQGQAQAIRKSAAERGWQVLDGPVIADWPGIRHAAHRSRELGFDGCCLLVPSAVPALRADLSGAGLASEKVA